MTDQEISIPTARQAMRYAITLAGDINATEVDLDRARTWVVIAAELRAGAVRPLDSKLQALVDKAATQRDAGPLSADIPNRDADLAADAERWAEWPNDAHGGDAPQTYREVVADPPTQRLEVVMPRCAHCGLVIEWWPNSTMGEWVHKLTRQTVCAHLPNGPAEDMTVTVVHTFATPEVPGDGS